MKVLDIQRMSTEDGPGLRTTVFFKGCPLSCAWCHNPESISPKSHVEWLGVRCIGCRTCEHVCPQHGIHLDATGVHTSQDCIACGTCTDACPTQALEMKGVERSVEELARTVLKDRAYWGEAGGVTLSGGEVTLQWQEARELLALLKESGVHTAVDTCGFVRREVLEALLPVTDLFLYDLKLFDDKQHRAWTGQSNARILENFEWLVSALGESEARAGEDDKHAGESGVHSSEGDVHSDERKPRAGSGSSDVHSTDNGVHTTQSTPRIWVRTPIIPGATDTDDNIRGLAGIVRDRVDKWELCAFNNLCRDKYERLGKTWDFQDAALMTRSRMEELTALAIASGAPRAVWSGMTALEQSDT